MNIPALKKNASHKVSQARDIRKIALVYAGINILAALLVSLVTFFLDHQISQSGGLSNLGTRSMLSAIQNFLPIVNTLAMMCLELGFLSAALRISRGQYASLHSLRAGLPRFWAMVRATLLQGLIYTGAGIAGTYLSIIIFVSTPLSSRFMEVFSSVLGDSTTIDPTTLVLDESVQLAMVDSMIPLLVIIALVLLVLYLPLFYRYRMVNYILLDKPACGAMAAMQESRTMMRGNALQLFKLDISLWWYYLVLLAAEVLVNVPALLAIAGIQLPLSQDALTYVFYGLYLAIQFAILYFLHVSVGVIYAAAYNAIKPEEPAQDGGVVLGNIFQM